MRPLPLPWPDAPPARLASTPEDIERGPDPGILGHGTQPQPVGQRFHQWAAEIATVEFDVRPPDGLRDELERLSREYPLIAKMLTPKTKGPAADEPPAAFELGTVHVSRSCKSMLYLADEELRGLLRQHQQSAPADGLVDGIVKSRHCLCSGPWLNAVRERQGFEIGHTIRGPLVRRESDELHILTLLGPTNETIAVSSRIGVPF